MNGTTFTRTELREKKIYVSVDELKLWESNPRAIEKVDYERLLKRVAGIQFKPLLVLYDLDARLNGTVLGGNMRVRAYKELGKQNVWVSVVEFDKVGNLYYAFINGEQDFDEQGAYRSFQSIEDGMLHYALTDNESFGKYMDQELAELIQPSELDLSDYKVNLDFPTTLLDLQKEFGPSEEEAVEEDEPPEVSQEEPKSKLGEVYQLGRHRLMCGDSTKIEDVEKLMNGQKADMVFTSPPYNANSHLDYGKGENKRLYENDLDNKDSKEYVAFLHESLFSAFSVTKGFIFWNVGYNANSRHEYIKGIYPFVDKLHETIIWKKTAMPVSNGITRNFEFVFCFNNGDKKHVGKEFDTEFGIWEISNINSQDKENHRASFPIALPTKGIELGSDKNSIVLDLFGGSGSTLIACEQLNRTCYMMELDEKYCDVIRKRYAKFIGQEDLWQEATPVVRNGLEEVESISLT